MNNKGLIFGKYHQRRLLIERILESGAEKVLNRFRGSSDYKGKIILDFADLREANLRYADLSDVSLVGANLSKVSFSGSKFVVNGRTKAVLRGALLFEVDLLGQNLAGVDLAHATFICSNLQGVNFSNAILYGASFDYSDCTKTVFTDAVLEKNANGVEENFGEVSFKNANIDRAIFSEERSSLMKKIREQAAESVGDFLIAITKRKELEKTKKSRF